MPTFTASAPAPISALVASRGGDVAGDDLDRVGDACLIRSTAAATSRLWPCAVSMTIRSHSASISACAALEALVADGGRGGDAQPPGAVLGRVGIGDRLLDVLDGDQADAAPLVVDHQQFLDPALVEQPARLLLADAGADGDEIVAGSSARTTGWRGFSAKRTSRLVRMPTSRPSVSVTGMPEIRWRCHQLERVGERLVGRHGDRVDHHAALEALDRAHRRGLLLDLHVAVEHAEPAQLRHHDRHVGLGHRVHRRGEDRDVERDLARHPGARVGLARQDATIPPAAAARRRRSGRGGCPCLLIRRSGRSLARR